MLIENNTPLTRQGFKINLVNFKTYLAWPHSKKRHSYKFQSHCTSGGKFYDVTGFFLILIRILIMISAMPICHLRRWDEHRFGCRSPTRNKNQSKFVSIFYPRLTFLSHERRSKRMILSWLSLFGHHSHHQLNKKWFPPLQKTHWRKNSMAVKSNGNLQINPNSRSKIELMILRIYRK